MDIIADIHTNEHTYIRIELKVFDNITIYCTLVFNTTHVLHALCNIPTAKIFTLKLSLGSGFNWLSITPTQNLPNTTHYINVWFTVQIA